MHASPHSHTEMRMQGLECPGQIQWFAHDEVSRAGMYGVVSTMANCVIVTGC
jgi:hypothetical protein